MSSTPPPAQPALVTELADRYRSAILAGHRGRAASAVVDGLAAGLDAQTLLSEVLSPAQRELGRLWHLGELTIAEEHRGTEITREELERIRSARRPRGTTGAAAVTCAGPGEAHSLAARFVATSLDCEGWEVEHLGEAPPGDGLFEHVRRRKPRLVAISVTVVENLQAIAPLLRQLASLEPRPALLVGGAAVSGLAPSDLAADAVAADLAAGLDFATGLLGPPPVPELPAYLAAVGGRIHAARLAAQWSQATLAERSGLTRPYLGAVERGRQNITLEAAHKIASALGLSLTDLLATP